MCGGSGWLGFCSVECGCSIGMDIYILGLNLGYIGALIQ